MRAIILIFLGFCTGVQADTIDHYMNIANQIPQMEIKADPQSQTWARSARTVMTLTCDNIIDSLNLANHLVTQKGQPLFCLPAETQLTTEQLDSLIQQTYRENQSQTSDKNKMTVSQVALMGLEKQFPCEKAG